MSDMMTFPDTVEEFMEMYKMIDTEEVYSNGTEYVPIYRMKQWFEHQRTSNAHPTHECVKPTHEYVDSISRQAAVDIERRATVDTNPEHFESHQKFVEFMDDAEISSFGRWQWSNGFNTALTAVGIDLKRLPSAKGMTFEEIAQLLSDLCGECACDVNGNDEWLPQACKYADTECPHPKEKNGCWMQFLMQGGADMRGGDNETD